MGDSPLRTKCGCDNKVTQQKKVGRYWCGDCREYFTAWTGTPLEYGKIDIRKWLFAAYLLKTARKGISSLQLSKELSISQPKVWHMPHHLRLDCGTEMQALSGEVEIDETYIGRKEQNKHIDKKLKASRSVVGKQAVL